MLSKTFQKSTKCDNSSPSCAFARINNDGDVDLMDSKTSKTVTFTPAEWDAFTAGVKAGEFDAPPLVVA